MTKDLRLKIAQNTPGTPRKRIVFFGIKYFPSRGGTSRVAESIIYELKEKYDITIYCYRHPEAANHMSNVRVITMPQFPFGAAGVFVYYFICCIHLLFSKKYDLIHAHKTDSAFFIPFLSWKSKVVATSHEAPYLRDKWNTFGKAYFRFMETVFVRSSATLTSVSKPLADYYFQTYQREVLYLPNGVDIDPTRNDQAAEKILRTHGVESEFLFFAARRIMSTKGCHTFLQAMKKINYTGPIVIAGQESHGAPYMNLLKSLAKGLNVKFIGFVGDKPTLMALVERAKYFIFPSEIEGLSLMLLEVGTTGVTPLICSDIPQNTQVFSDKEVLFFRNQDVDDLVEKFQWAEEHPEEMATKMKQAQDWVNREYSSEVFAARYDFLYQQILTAE